MFNAVYFRTFITLVDTGSFTQTARRLEMTQPGVSQHIRKLEAYLGKDLIRREGRRFTLTEAGRRSYDYALRLFIEHEQFYHSLDEHSVNTGECWIASPSSVGLMFYPFTLGYQQLYPTLSINYSFLYNHDILRGVREGAYDLGLVTEVPRRGEPGLECELWHHEPLCLVVPSDFSGTGFADLQALGFVSYANGEENAARVLRSNFAQEFRSMNRFPNRGVVSEVGHVLDAVARGLGFTVVSQAVLETSPWQRQVRELPLAQPEYEEIFVVRRSSEDLPQRYKMMLDAYGQQRYTALYESTEAPQRMAEV